MANPIIDIVTRLRDEASGKIKTLNGEIKQVANVARETTREGNFLGKEFEGVFNNAITGSKTFRREIGSAFIKISNVSSEAADTIKKKYDTAFENVESIAKKAAANIQSAEEKLIDFENKSLAERRSARADFSAFSILLKKKVKAESEKIESSLTADLQANVAKREKLLTQQSKTQTQIIKKNVGINKEVIDKLYADYEASRKKEIELFKESLSVKGMLQQKAVQKELALTKNVTESLAKELTKRQGFREDISAEEINDLNRTLDNITNAIKENEQDNKAIRQKYRKEEEKLVKDSALKRIKEEEKLTNYIAANQGNVLEEIIKVNIDRVNVEQKTQKKIRSIIKKTGEEVDKVAKESTTSMKSAAKQTSNAWFRAAEKIGQTMTQLGRDFIILGSTITAAFAIPILKAFEVEKAMGVVNAITNATTEEYREMTDAARELGRSTVFTAAQASEGMQDLARAGFEVMEIVGAMPNVLNLAAAAQLGIAESAKISANIMRGYGLTVQDLTRVNDVLVTGFTESTTDLTALGVAFRYAGPLAKTAGLELEETAGILSAFANAGFQGSIAGTSLRNALTRLASPSKQAQKMLDRLGISISDDEGRMLGFVEIVDQFEKALSNVGGEAERTAVLVEIFGQRAGPAMGALIDQGSEKLDEMMSKFDDIKGVTGEIATKQLDTLYGAWVKLTSAISTLLIVIGQPFLTPIKKIVLAFREMINIVTNLAEKFPALTVTIFTIVGAVGAVITGIGAFIFIVGGAVLAIGKLSAITNEFALAANKGAIATTRFSTSLKSLQGSAKIAATSLKGVTAAFRPLVVSMGITVGIFAAIAGATWIFNKAVKSLGESVDKYGVSKLEKLKGAFIDTWEQLKIVDNYLKSFIPSFKSATKETDSLAHATTTHTTKLKEAALAQERYANKVKNFYLPAIKKQMAASLEVIKNEEELKTVRKSILEQFDYHTKQMIANLKKQKVSQEELKEYEKSSAEERVKYVEDTEKRIKDIRKAATADRLDTYNQMINDLEVGSDTWFTIEKVNLDRLKSAATDAANFRKKLVKDGLLDIQTAANMTINEQERIYKKEKKLLEERLLNIELLTDAQLEEAQALYKRMERLDLEYIEKTRSIEQTRINDMVASNQKQFDKWKALTEARTSIAEAQGKTELALLREHHGESIVSTERYIQRELDLFNESQEARFDIINKNTEKELEANRLRLESLAADEIAVRKKIDSLLEGLARDFTNDTLRAEYTKRVELLQQTLDEMKTKREAALANEEVIVAEREKLYEKMEQDRIAGEKRIADATIASQKKADSFIKNIIGQRAEAAQKEVEEQIEQLDKMYAEGLVSSEDYYNAKEALQKKSAETAKKAIKDEEEAIEQLSETQQTNFQAIAEGILLYKKMSAEAKALGGVAAELATTFDKFAGTIHLGGIEAEALKAAMSGSAEDMLMAAEALETYAEQAAAFSEGTDRITRTQEAAAAAMLLREEASRKLAMADREAALSMERLTAATQEYLGIASSARSAISTFAGLVEDLQFAIENNLLTQDEYNSAIDELTESLTKAVPEGSELYNMITSLLNSLLSGTITIDFFTSALSEMTKAGFDAAQGMDQLSDSLAGHSVTTAADAASASLSGLTGTMRTSIGTTKNLLNGMQSISNEMLNNFGQGDIFSNLNTQYINLNNSLQQGFNNTTRLFEDNVNRVREIADKAGDLSLNIDVQGFGNLNAALDQKIQALKQITAEVPGLSSDINIQRDFTFELKSDITTFDGEAADRWLNTVVFPKMQTWLEMRGTTV